MKRIAAPVIAAAALLAGASGFPGGTADGGPARRGPVPRVVASYPYAGASALLSDPVVLRFNTPLAPATVNASTIQVLSGTDLVPGTVTAGLGLDGRTDPRYATWRPLSPLVPAGFWRIHVTRDLQSLGGRELADPFSAEFTTHADKDPDVSGEIPEGTRLVRAPGLGPVPKIRFTFPQAGLGNVFTDEVVLRFSQPMDAAAFEGGTFGILQNGAQLPGSLSFPEEWDGREVVFTPEHPLFRDTTFQMRVTRDARSARGRHLRDEFVAGFGTSPFKGGVKPIRPEDFVDSPVNSLPVGIAFHTVTQLPTGDLVVAGGQDLGGTPLSACYRWNSASGSFSILAALGTARRKHAAVMTRDGGVMVIGGFGPTGQTLSTTEVYDPVADAWTPGPSMATSRASHTATVVAGTRILVAGGFSNSSGTLAFANGAEVYNPFLDSWSATAGSPVVPRGGHAATLLNDGRVLLTGGTPNLIRQDELYNPATGTFLPTQQPTEWRVFHAACLTKAGDVLIAGGGPGRAEVYDVNSNSFREAGFCPPFQLPVTSSPDFATLTLIPGGGRIAMIGGLVYGGSSDGSDLVLDQVQVWDPAGNSGAGAFYPMLFDMDVPRAAHTVTPMASGGFLIIGGLGTDGIQNERRVTIFQPSQ